MTDDVLANMRDRAARCRRLAQGTLNQEDSRTLLKMAEEIEADIRRLERDRS